MPDEFLESTSWAAQLVRAKIENAQRGRYRFAANEYRPTSQRLNGLAREVERSVGQATDLRAADVLRYLNETRQLLEEVATR